MVSKKAFKYLERKDQYLSNLSRKIKEWEVLNNKVLSYLGPNLAKSCQVGQIVKNKLIMIASHGAAATELRFQTYDLLIKFKADPLLNRIQQIECKVRPLTTLPIKRNQHMPLLSEKTSKIIHDIAITIHDEPLRKIMEKISKRTK